MNRPKAALLLSCLASCLALLAAVAATAGATAANPRISVQITVVDHQDPQGNEDDLPTCSKGQASTPTHPCGPDEPGFTHTQHYMLTCDPTGGTVTLAHQACADIALHPGALLVPRPPTHLYDGCGGFPGVSKIMTVAITNTGVTSTSLIDLLGCNSQTAFALFYETLIKGSSTALTAIAPGFHCPNAPLACIPRK